MKTIFSLLIFLFAVTSIFPQPSGDQYRRSAIINGNSIQTVLANYAVIAQPGNIGPRGTWNGINNVYIGDMSILLGLELPIDDYWMGNIPPDGIPDTIHSVIITPVDRPGGGESGFNFEPNDSFFNPNITDPTKGVALSNYPETWPAIWPDHPEYGTGVWNGLYGPDVFVGDQEAYFKIDDANDQEFNFRHKFYPDPSDTTKRGHGLEIFVRYVQLDHPLFKDILFRIYDIKNISVHNYHKLVFGNLVGTYIGGEPPEWNDDVPLYYFLDDFILSFDFDNYINPSANPNWEGDVGMFGEAFIQAPNNNHIASFQYFVPSGNITMNNDEDMWLRLEPGFYEFPPSVIIIDSIPYATRGEDGDDLWGSEYFTLDTGETKRFSSVLSFGYSKAEVFEKIRLAEVLYHAQFDTVAIHEAINLSSHNYHKTVSGTDQIQWQAVNSVGTVEIWYSPDGGNNWNYVTKNAPNTGSYNWNTTNFQDGSFASIKIYIKNEDGYIYGYDDCDSYFTVNNSGNGKPYMEILNDEFGSGGTFTQENYDFNLLVGDPENEPLLINVYYNLDTDTTFLFSQSINAVSDTLLQIYNIDFKSIPNSQNLRIKLEVTDGELTYSDITPRFAKETPRTVLTSLNFEIVSGYAEVPIEVRVIDSTKFRGHEYIISFEDTLWNEDYKTFSVYNVTRNEYALRDTAFYPFAESVSFDGMVLYAEDIETELDQVTSRWNNPHPLNLGYVMSQFTFPAAGIYGYKDPFDYIVSFSDEYNDSSNYLSQIFQNPPPANYNINFKVYGVISDINERIQFAFTESNNFRKDTLSYLDQVTYSNPEGTELSWKVVFTGDLSSTIPTGGDTLYLFTLKGLSKYDTLRVFDLPAGILNENNIPEQYSLAQNYPNPFNPFTTIRFEIPVSGNVSIKIYDILGSEVKTLVNEEKNAGKYEVVFNASKFASGVYFYQLRAGDFVSTKKMILLK